MPLMCSSYPVILGEPFLWFRAVENPLVTAGFGGMVYHVELSLRPNKTIIWIHISSIDMVEKSVASYSLLVSFHASDSSVAKLF